MPTNVYECMFILDPNRYARDPNALTERIEQMVEKCGGHVLASRLWNEQKLAYPIQGHRKGVYWLTYCRMDGGNVADLKRACRLNDSVLRSLVLKVEPRLVDALVAHARGDHAPPGLAEPEKEAAAAVDEPSGRRSSRRSPAGDD